MSVFEQYTVVGGNDSDGDSVYLRCKRCPVDVPYAVVKRFQTNHWDDPATVCTLQDLFSAAREHEAEHHNSYRSLYGSAPVADTGEINVIRGRE
jgi:hypothetical protein